MIHLKLFTKPLLVRQTTLPFVLLLYALRQ